MLKQKTKTERPPSPAARVDDVYPVRVTDHVRGTIRHDNDPIAKQYTPDIRELKILPSENTDPIGDNAHSPLKGIVHRYTDRALLKLTHICAVYCRYCFRRDMVGKPDSGMLKPDERAAAMDYIRRDKNIWEVILTGGDPFILSARQLKDTLDELCAIDHVKVIRVHTRVPVADPARVTDELCAALKRTKAVYVVLHINHAQEITPEVESAMAKLRAADCVLLSQSVLLKDVNDDPAVLEDLFRALTARRVKPYYIHHPDMAPGTSHFRLPLKRGRAIMRALFARLSGIAMPHYMLDIPGGAGKIPVGPDYVVEEDGFYRLSDPKGGAHDYKDE